MNIKVLAAALTAFGGAVVTQVGDTLILNQHTITLSPNGNVNVDHCPVGKVNNHSDDDDKVAIVQTILEVTQ